MVIEACLYNIQVIGEAVNQLADDVKNANRFDRRRWVLPNIPRLTDCRSCPLRQFEAARFGTRY
jgi:hypothetical protein